MPAAAIPAIISAVATVASTLLAPKPDAPKAQKPTPMPTSATEDAARRQSIIDQQKRQGRASTILTDGSDTLG